jgi:hypothetical protein
MRSQGLTPHLDTGDTKERTAVNQIPEELRDLLINMSAKNDILPQDRIYHDLGIRGEDAGELIDFMHHQYGVDFLGLKFNDFFPDEILTFRDLWGFFKCFPASGKREVTVMDLVRISRSRKWDLS